VPHRHHGDCDYEAIIDGDLGQESIEASSPIHGDQCEAQYQEYAVHYHSVDVSDLIAEVMYLKAALTLSLHLMRVSLCKTCNHLCSGREVVNWPGVIQVAHLWCSGNGADEIRGQVDLCASNPGEKGITNPPMDVGIELPHQLCDGWVVIFYHLSPTLGL
jgi:hypothetical protein